MRGALLLVVGAAITVALPRPAPADPVNGPTGVGAVAIYSTPPAIRVRWNDVPDETRYEVWRAVDGAPIAKVGDPGQNVTTFVDSGVNNASAYRYRLFACDAVGCKIGGEFTTSVSVKWPISGGREVLHGFNEVLAWAGIRGGDGVTSGYHDGVDLNRTTSGATAGDDVRAPRGGIVNQVIPNNTVADDGFVAVLVDLGGGNVEYDSFNHIANTGGNGPIVAVGDVVAPGQKLARVGTQRFAGDFTDHVHSMVTVGSAFASSARHFLTIFTADADRDPLGNSPALFDENGDGKKALYRDHGDATPTNYLDYDHDTKPLSGDLDIHVEVTDSQGTNPRQAPIDLAYWVEGPLPDAEDLDDVKSAAKPYKLYDFRTNYFGLGAPTNCSLLADIQDTANSGCKGLANCTAYPGAACNSVVKEGTTNFPWPILHHFIVTHAKGETGVRADVDVNQYWRTRAKEDNAATPAHANYAGKPLATKPTDARFPDGDYTIHVVASDLVHPNVDLQIQKVRLENYPPFIKELTLYQDRDNSAASQVDADHPGCEFALYNYKHQNPNPYPGPGYLATSQQPAFAAAGRKICVRVRFSEGMDTAWASFRVELDPQGAGGAAPIAFAGAFGKKYTDNDTWKGSLTVTADNSGNSDSSLTDPGKDAIVRLVARDMKDRNNAQRGLDENGDGTGEADAADLNHRIKLDASAPVTTIQIRKVP
ncbi:hypothetical protein L6Q96_17425 [Candidatus Binatia bacterium]|nr:hypothetical protein [Candidatus Binatia bacterium]